MSIKKGVSETTDLETKLTPSPRLLVISANFYPHINQMLISGATSALRSEGAQFEVIELPGALEISPAISIANQMDLYEGYVALGCVIRGETIHFEIVCQESAHGLTSLATKLSIAIGNGILTVENERQALERADPQKLDKGGAAAYAALKLISLRRKMSLAKIGKSGAAGE